MGIDKRNKVKGLRLRKGLSGMLVTEYVEPEKHHKLPPIQTLGDVVDAMANILYIYGADDRSGWESFAYERIFSAAQKDVEGKDEKLLVLEDMERTKIVVGTILMEEADRMEKGRINEERFTTWILEHVIKAYQFYLRENFLCALEHGPKELEKRYYW